MTNTYFDSDEALVIMARSGNDSAFEELFTRYSPMINRIASKYFILGADRSDTVQEGSLGLFRAVLDFSPEKNTNFSTFAYICITGSIISAVKRASRKRHMPLNEYISIFGTEETDGDEASPDFDTALVRDTAKDPETLFIDNETIRSVRAYINEKLSAFEKKVFTLYLQNKSYQQIAEETGKNVKSVDNAIQRVKRKLISAL